MPRRPIDDTSPDEGSEFDPTDYGWTVQEWEELKDIYGVDSYDELIDMFPELVDFADWIDELDYVDDIGELTDDDFYAEV